MKEYGLVLAGGGTKGAYQVGVWKALKELNINVTSIVGTSIGALNGAFFLQNDLDKIEKLYENIQINDIMEVGDKIDENKNIFQISNLSKIIGKYISNKGISNLPLRNTIEKYVDVNKIYNSNIDFGLITVNINNKVHIEKFKNEIPKEEMIDYLLASACFPIFKAQEIEQSKFLDGGLYDNIPINTLLNKGYKNIIAVDITGVGFNRRMVSKKAYIKMISPKEKIGGTFEFNHERIKENIKLGYLDTKKSFNKLQGHIYYFKEKEFTKMLETFGLQTIYGLEYSAQIYGIDKYKEYNFEDFILALNEKNLEAMKKYDLIKDNLNIKNIVKLKNQVDNLFEKGLGICLAKDIYLGKPMSKSLKFLEHYIKDYIEAGKALIELEDYLR